MSTLVEILDEQQILNILTAAAICPDRTIFLYEAGMESLLHNEVVERYTGDTLYLQVNYEDIDGFLNSLSGDDIVFDIEGGNDMLVAMVTRFADANGWPLYFPDTVSGNMLILRGSEKYSIGLKWPKLSVKDMIALYGGKVRDLPEPVFTEEGRKAVEACMKTKRKSTKRWTNFCKTMGAFNRRYPDTDTWMIDGSLYSEYKLVFNDLRDLFSEFEKTDRSLKITLADPAYRMLITDGGVAFEYDTYYQLLDEAYFDDLVLRVNIDWNGGVFEKNDPNSELDVVATKDGRLISISCKAGKYDQQAIYEVKANAVKFGGQRALAVLCNDNEQDHKELVEKAKELGVLLIEHKDMWNHRAFARIREWLEES